VICIVHPNRHTRSGAHERTNLDWVGGKTLRAYLRDAKLSGMKRRCRADVLDEDGLPTRIKTSHVPKDGDVIRLTGVGGM